MKPVPLPHSAPQITRGIVLGTNLGLIYKAVTEMRLESSAQFITYSEPEVCSKFVCRINRGAKLFSTRLLCYPDDGGSADICNAAKRVPVQPEGSHLGTDRRVNLKSNRPFV
jgi:hypothetical protein